MYHKKNVICIAVGCFLLFMMISPTLFLGVNAQTTADNYRVTVNSTTESAIFYTTVGRNWSISFNARWSYGSEAGQLISNATATIEITSRNGAHMDTLEENTATGAFVFNYSSSSADILTFNVTKLVTQDGTEWNTALIDKTNNLYGLASKPVTVWWDTFHVQMLSHNTSKLGVTTATVNVTYLLLPEEGLTLPASDTYSNQTFLSKIAHNVDVTINGAKAQETTIPAYTKRIFQPGFPRPTSVLA